MKFLKGKKALMLYSSMLMATIPVAAVVSCTSKQATAAENRIKELLTGPKMKTLLQQQFFKSIIDSEYENSEKKWKGEWTEKIKQAAMKDAWDAWASNKIKSNNNFWPNEVNKMVSNGVVTKAEMEMEKWIPAISGNVIVSKNVMKTGYYPPYTIAKKIMKNHPELGWGLELYKLLLSEIWLTTAEKVELMTGDEVDNYQMESDKSKEVKADAKKRGGLWFKEDGDQPSLLLRTDREVKFKGKTENFFVKYFFLNQYLFDNKPQFVWEKSTKENAIAGSKIQIKNSADFNAVNSRQRDLLGSDVIFDNQIIESNKTQGFDRKLISKLEGFKGFTTPKITDKGDVNISVLGLKKRLKDNSSKSGFLNEEGELIDINAKTSNKAGTFIKDGSAVAEYVQQFLPHFIAFNIKSLQTTISKDSNYRGAIEISSGIYTTAEWDAGTKWFKDTAKFPKSKYVDIKEETEANSQDYTKTDKMYKNGLKDHWVHLTWDAKTHQINGAFMGEDKQLIKDPEQLKYVEEGDQSFFFADSNLVDKSNRSNLRRLIFQFALSSNSIISDAKRFMVNVRSYELSVKNDRTREALKGLGLWKEG
ncbi:MAG: hypothetical protein GY679_03720 [Mycoplasma sp.]|nr:hypothetical protein [Mycoplasma sp.]